MREISGGVTSAKGFSAASAAAEIKYQGRDDMALIYSEFPAVSAGVYTTNVVKAAPVIWDKKITDSDNAVCAVVVNSGIANACTGEEGINYCSQTAKAAASGINTDNVLVASTGVIGMDMPMDRVLNGVNMLVNDLGNDKEHGTKAACAIMTTDTIKKEACVTFEVDGKTVTVGGMSKGSGMIHPNMCTMLAFVTTDINISKELLVKALKEDVKDTYNMISVDGDTSTNDSLILLANGACGNAVIDSEGEDYDAFCEALHFVNRKLAMTMAGDGEGASKLFEVKVDHADTRENARILARSVVSSSLTKAAVFGNDANWGRILCALGYSGVDFDPQKVALYLESSSGRIHIAEHGRGIDFSEDEATKILGRKKVTAIVDMGSGEESATAWGCDLTYDYIKINADYRS